ncbi:MAG: hypothetical protein CMH50_13640 [Myxococcales bacterium]|nr:hypothetical protein [Myxococcales bacterium]|tara:strand:- start:1272 stop:1970 length:699 start_codon:yes stop_codon:yes gene_type:complete
MSRLSNELREDLQKLESRLKVGKVVGVVLVLFVAGYLHFAYTQFQMVTDPDELAGFSAGFLATHLETVVDEVGTGARNEAPAVVGKLYEAAGDGLGAVRVGVQEKIASTHGALSLQVIDWSTDYFARVVKENQQLRGLKAGEPLTEDAFGGMRDGFARDLDEFFADSQVDDEVAQATEMIKGIADRLEKLAYNQGLTAQEKEERELLVAWFQMVAPDFAAPTEPLEAMEQSP